MKEFVSAALPLVLAGVAVAIICAGIGKDKSEENEKKMEQYIAIGAGIGLVAGTALNFCDLWNQALGLTVGPLWGMALATVIGNHRNRKRKMLNEKMK